MRRLIRLMLHSGLIIAAAVISFIAVDVAISPGNGPAALYSGLMAAALGLVLGLLVAWLRGIPWRLIPVAFRLGFRKAQDECWWMTAGAASIGVLMFY